MENAVSHLGLSAHASLKRTWSLLHTHTYSRANPCWVYLAKDPVVLVWYTRGTQLSYASVLHAQYARSEDPIDIEG